MKVNDVLYDENSEVALGSNIKLEFTSVGSLTEFYVSECVATNELDSSDDDYQALSIIQSGCPVDKENDPELTIDPRLIDDAQTLSFNQFAFISEGTYLTLSFFSAVQSFLCEFNFTTDNKFLLPEFTYLKSPYLLILLINQLIFEMLNKA